MDHFEHHHKSEFANSALQVNSGVEQPPIVNPHFKKRKKKVLTVDDYIKGITSGDITILSRAITLIESILPSDYDLSQEIIEKCLPYSGNSVRVGITGVPGAGKSTFIEAIGTKVTNMGHKLAVLAIDPSSEKSGGSILGDKTRMETLIQNKNAFIRPSPTAGSLGGVARKTRETIILCEAAGFDVIFIETVGVGQSETSVHSMVDLFLMLQIAGAGDELQGIKRGIMEMADMIGVTKSDGENVHRASLAKAHFKNALNLFPMPKSGWKPRVYTCSSIEGTGLLELWSGIEDFMNFTKDNGYFESHRAQQSKYWMYETINESLRTNFYRNQDVASKIKDFESRVVGNQVSPFVAAKELLETYKGNF
ncbi:MAG: methylmalonyl Co-A mutase-associated GTPase MeaB [Rikenellaceae bacterium]